MNKLIEQVRNRIADGLPEEAVAMARTRDTRGVRDSDLHVAWADLLEELGMVEEVILELNLAIRDDPERLELYPRLAEVFVDQGLLHRAVKVWNALIRKEPLEPRWYEGLGEALKEQREFEKARDVYQTALEKTTDPRFSALLRDLGFLQGQDRPHAEAQEPEALLPQKHQLVTFTSLFSGREGVYARQWVSPTGESGYSPVEEPLTLKVAENHILGNYTVGVYPVRLDNTVNFVAFDFDAAKFAVKKAITREKAWKALVAKVHSAAGKLMDLAASHDVPVYIEDSGFKGRHVWIFLESPIPAGVAKKFGDTLVSLLPAIPAEVTVEVFPKQGSVRRGGLGNLIKLPLGVHKRTGKRGIFVEPNGQPVPDQLGLLENVSRAGRKSLYALIQRFHEHPAAPRPAPAAGEHEPEPSESREPVLPSPPEEYDLDRDPQFQALMLKCPTLQAIVEKVNRTSTLSSDETQVLIHTLGHMDQGPQAMNDLFRRCVNTDPALFLKSKLRGNPMSCPKIRARVPEISSAVPCNCTFDLSVNLYPTPLIHVHNLGRGHATPLGLTVDSLQFQNLVQDYLKLRKQYREISLLIDRYEERLIRFFEDAGVESVQTPTGKLTMVKQEGVKASFTLDL